MAHCCAGGIICNGRRCCYGGRERLDRSALNLHNVDSTVCTTLQRIGPGEQMIADSFLVLLFVLIPEYKTFLRRT